MVKISANMEIAPSNYKEFYVYYMVKHSSLWCRRLHVLGTLTGVTGTLVGALYGNLALVATSVAAGVGLCWAGDKYGGDQTPTTFKYPVWSVCAHFRMVWSILKGDLRA